ncbi:hypothetical protein WAI453_008009 [Rhynchosporium graminicola]
MTKIRRPRIYPRKSEKTGYQRIKNAWKDSQKTIISLRSEVQTLKNRIIELEIENIRLKPKPQVIIRSEKPSQLITEPIIESNIEPNIEPSIEPIIASVSFESKNSLQNNLNLSDIQWDFERFDDNFFGIDYITLQDNLEP